VGDVPTHAEISGYVAREWSRLYPGQVDPGKYTYLELGNFLTDVSQVRDPPAHENGREIARGHANWFQAALLWATGPGLDAWLNGMFGSRAGTRHGWLAGFLQHVVYAATHMIFATDGLLRPGSGIPAVSASPFAAFRLVSPADIDAVLAARFTQYWPHEHVDFPPVADGRTIASDSLFRAGARHVASYLEWDFQYLSEALSKLELEWVTARNASGGAPVASPLLVRLGHLLHAVEDYYFHSNFCEIRNFQRLVGGLSPGSFGIPVTSILSGTRYDTTSVPLRRIAFRRIRYPVFADAQNLSRSTSEEGTATLYTGGFGATELWHTLGGALEAVEHLASVVGLSSRLTSSPLILVRLLFNESARRAMVSGGDNARKANQARHREQLLALQYENAINDAQTHGHLSRRGADELRQAFELDRTLERTFPDLGGVGQLLIAFLAMLQQERDASRAAATRLDGQYGSISDLASDNGASAERIGTHTLLSKDSRSKEPFRPDAVMLAKHASMAVVFHLAERLGRTTDVNLGVDWDTVLRHYLRFPAAGTATWEEAILTMSAANAAAPQPSWDQVPDRANHSLLGPSLQPEKLAARRAGTTTADLEAYYRRFEH
jgi:hypothetical protein